MKFSFFGLTISSSWGNGHATPYRALLKALAARGHEVTFYERDVEYYYWRRDFAQSDYCRLVLYPSWREIRTAALRDAASADAVILGSYTSEGARIADDLLDLASPRRVFYDLDTPVTLSGLRRGDLEYLRRDQLREFDLVFSFTGGPVLAELVRDFGVRRAAPLYGCVDPDVYRRTQAAPELRSDLSYMGTYSQDRQQKLQQLFLGAAAASPARRFLLAGTMYPPDIAAPKNVERVDHVAPARHAEFYSSSRVTLNLTREGMARGGWCPSGRFFEAAACGTPLLSDWFTGLGDFFRDGEELIVVRSTQDVLAALDRDPAELARIAARARQRTLDEHTGAARAQQFLAALAAGAARVAAGAAVADADAEYLKEAA